MLDYAVVSPWLEHFISTEADTEGPWSPHLALKITVNLAFPMVITRQQIKPREAPVAQGPCRQSWDEYFWPEPIRKTDTTHRRPSSQCGRRECLSH